MQMEGAHNRAHNKLEGNFRTASISWGFGEVIMCMLAPDILCILKSAPEYDKDLLQVSCWIL